MGENSTGPTLSVPRRLKITGTIVVVLLAVWAGVLGARTLLDRTAPPEFPASDVRDWATFADHVVLGTAGPADTDRLEVTTVLWSRQGAHPIGRRISIEADLTEDEAYAVPVAWFEDGSTDGRWVALTADAVLRLDAGRITGGGATWAADHAGESPRVLATELYETGPHPAAVPYLYESLEQRLAAVER
ncbi:hypothetical protein [Nocardioides albus]|uniref:Uncharacterized protein n=1 Tax=Nocardioides albus TaxID=1841 RepID=A0A7W5A930_9ACTN|nr:hypothetical protein [Nocardioides albus]MBB3091640.1 hypothetical protein [Nocardioides albus]GGU44940.1 hypothetical protein GCM10007979_50100 [Nocardioides albus]